jgi:4-carboxymuconolactone decarboxylase
MPSSATFKAMTPSRPPGLPRILQLPAREFMPAKAGRLPHGAEFSNCYRGGINMPTPDPREALRAVVPKLMDLTDKVLFGDVWERPGLSKRDRSLITVAVLTALYRPEQLRGHIGRALTNGVTKDEISEIITHLAFYSGWPTAVTAAAVAKSVFEEHK